MYESIGTILTGTDGRSENLSKKEDTSLEKKSNEYSELADVFPALEKYRKDHCIDNLKKLCVELSEFCLSIYASTRNEQERKVYFGMIKKLNK